MRLFKLSFYTQAPLAALLPLPANAANWGQENWGAFEWQASLNVPLPLLAVAATFFACAAIVAHKK